MDVRLPNLGEGADSGVVVNLFVKEGDVIEKDQPILELENEKAVATVPSPVAGTIAKVFVKSGDKINVGQRLISLASATEAAPVAAAAPSAGSSEPPKQAPPSTAASTATEAVEGGPEGEGKPSAPPAASPSLRRLALDLGIDLNKVRGTERGGRIVMGDLKVYIQRLEKLAAQAQASQARTPRAVAEKIDFSRWGPVTIKPLSPLRQVIGRRMSESWASVPRVTQFDEADISAVLELREKYASAYEQRGTRLTLTGFAIKAVAAQLQKHLLFNTSLDETEENLVVKAYFHIGIAVDTEAGLMVPVIRDVDKKTMVEISRDLETLAQKARDRKISTDELKGGSFTISNQGGIGSGHFTPIVNKPEVAILGIGRGAVKPVWREGKFEPRTLLPLALSYDHRVIDGGQAARFMVDLVRAFEQFDETVARV